MKKDDSDKRLTAMTEGSFRVPTVMLKLLFDGESGLVHGGMAVRLNSQPVIIGRIPCGRGLKVSDTRVSRQHAKVWLHANGYEILCEDMSSNGTFVNGRRVKTKSLSDGDVLRVGNSFLLIRVEPRRFDDARIPQLVGDSPAMAKVRRSISKIAPSNSPVLVCGPSGTGKELVARAVHEYSDHKGPFVSVNCAAIPLSLAESRLFGRVASSVTDGDGDQRGYIRMAEGGTLFLDEIGELPLEIQPELLRALEDLSVTAVGGTGCVPVDVRVVAATSQDLEQAVKTQDFFGDLYALISEFTILTPRLTERIEDVLRLFEHNYDARLPALSPELVEALLLHTWPFNILELTEVVAELKLHGKRKSRLDLDDSTHCFLYAHSSSVGSALPPLPEKRQVVNEKPDEDITLVVPVVARTLEGEPIPSKERIENLLVISKGNIFRLSRSLNRSRRQICQYLEMYGLDPESYRE